MPTDGLPPSWRGGVGVTYNDGWEGCPPVGGRRGGALIGCGPMVRCPVLGGKTSVRLTVDTPQAAL